MPASRWNEFQVILRHLHKIGSRTIDLDQDQTTLDSSHRQLTIEADTWFAWNCTALSPRSTCCSAVGQDGVLGRHDAGGPSAATNGYAYHRARRLILVLLIS